MPVELLPRSTPAPTTAVPRSTVKVLAGGGLFSAIGDAFYKNVSPIKVPISNVQPAAPVDVAAAWDAADAAGTAAGTKALDGAQAALKESLDKVEMAPAYSTELQQRHLEFLKGQQQKLSTDPAYYASRANQLAVQQESLALIDPTRIMANTNEYKQWGEDEKQLRESKQLDDVALDADGNPMDKTYGDMFNMYRTEESPNVLRQYFPLKRDGSGKVSGSTFRMTLPSGTHQDAYSEVNQLEEKIKPWSTEVGTTHISEQTPAAMQAIYQQLGGNAYGLLTSNHKTKTEQNLDIIKAISGQLSKGDAWRKLLSPNAAQSLLAEQYRAVSKKYSNFGQTLGIKGSTLQLSVGNLPLGSNHLEAREKLLDVLKNPRLPDEDRQKVGEAYSKLRAYDLTQAEQEVRTNLVTRLGLKKFVSTSDLTDKSMQTGGLKPDASKEDGGIDLRGAVKYGTGLDFMPANTSYEMGKDKEGKPVLGKGLPYISAAIPGSGEMHDYLSTLTTNTDSEGKTTPKTLGELTANGIGVYNAHTMRGIARPGSTDASLNKIKVLPGGGQFTYLPHDPRDLTLAATRDKIAGLEKEASAVLAKLQEAKTSGNAQQIQMWEAAKAANLQKATAAGLVPAFRVRMAAQQTDLATITPFINSLDAGVDAKHIISPGTRSMWDLDASVTQKTGVRSISKKAGEDAGLETSTFSPDDFVEFDGYLTDPNFHITGSEKSQLRNTKINNNVQQYNAGQGMQAVQGAASWR